MEKIFKKFIADKRRIIKISLFLFLDIFFIILSVCLAFFLRFEGNIPAQHFLNLEGMIFLSLFFSIPIFYFLRLYSFSWAYVSADELISLVQAAFLSFLFLTTSIFILGDQPLFSGFPRSTIFISYFLIILFSGAIRFSKRIYLQIFQKGDGKEKERTLIVGSGDAGEQILRSILSFKFGPYLPVGFVDDNPDKKGVLIHGLKVLGKIDNIPLIVKEKDVECLIIALPSAGRDAIRTAAEKGREAGLKKIKILPSINEIMSGSVKVGIGALREIQMEDLLGREAVVLDQKAIEAFIENKKILITGGAGSIGSEFCRQTARFKPSLLLILDQDETAVFNISEELKEKFNNLKIVSMIADIQDKTKMSQIFKEFNPSIVFHAAAYKHVPLMEEHPDEAVKNNILGTKTIAELALENHVDKFVFISTDKAVNPKSVMGASKRIGEMICQTLSKKNSTKFISVRFGNVLDSQGSVIPIFKEQIKNGGPVKVTHPEMMRYFMTTSEACLLVMQAAMMGQGGEVFVLDMGKPVKIKDLAKELIRLSGLEPDKDIAIVYTQPRPGEKIFEEILTAKEGTLATENKKIFIAKLSGVDEEKLKSGLEKLSVLAHNGDKVNIVKTLKELIPTYDK
ncbi:MAG: nucleoside-diphosphate sugar epimerase/dehydratase [Candidatus Nealsonbacteria bacterium]|nr:nucleoside-diphosphate sugar epimerase/dehydratase [Candidatus Nealsonbacteria bacterium]